MLFPTENKEVGVVVVECGFYVAMYLEKDSNHFTNQRKIGYQFPFVR